MFSFFNNKPRKRVIKLSKLKAGDIEHVCTAEYVELMIQAREDKISLASHLRNSLDHKATFYFVVLKNYKYGLVPFHEFWPRFIDLQLKFGPPSSKASECLEHYINSINKS